MKVFFNTKTIIITYGEYDVNKVTRYIASTCKTFSMLSTFNPIYIIDQKAVNYKPIMVIELENQIKQLRHDGLL